MKEKKSIQSEYTKTIKEKSKNRQRRTDLIVTSFCIAALLILLLALKQLNISEMDIKNTNFLVFAGISFLIAILISIFSQLISCHSSRTKEKQQLKKLNNYINLFNISSIIFLFLGLFLLTYFSHSIF